MIRFYFSVRKTIQFYVSCLNFSIETKIKTLFLISYFNLSKKRGGTLGTRIFHLTFKTTLDRFAPLKQKVVNPCSNLLIKTLQQCHWRNSSVAVYHFSAWYYFAPRCIYCLFHILNGIRYTEAQRFKAQHCTPIELLSREFLFNSPKFTNQLFTLS